MHSCVCRFASLAILFLGTILLAGCGEPDSIGKTVPVSGKVIMDGTQLNTGAVSFHPDESKGNKAAIFANGVIKDGVYTLQTTSSTGSKPGVPPGWYKATVQTNIPMGGMETNTTGKIPMIPKGAPIAQKYTDATKTPLSVEVKENAPAGQYDLQVHAK
jgi:hypothetical protein